MGLHPLRLTARRWRWVAKSFLVLPEAVFFQEEIGQLLLEISF
jgi:CHAD domain-containing protein